MKRIAGTVLALATTVASFSAAALGLGQVEVLSKHGQPLVAEIPIVTSDPGELEQLQVGLASPDTFLRIGLRPPVGIIADLQFTQALDARGNPVIRVTSSQPVTEPLLTFLVEVDWGQGRLVREYAALIDTPRTFSAPLQPEIAAPTVEAPALIERPAETPASDVAATEPAPESDIEPAPESTEQRPDTAIAAAPQEPQSLPARPVAVPVRAAPVAPSALDGSDYSVRRGDTLSQIAVRMQGVRSGASLDQTMIALLRANPDAFIGGNVNLLKAGAVLRMPDVDALTELDAQQASAIVHSQTQEWRASRRAVPQPAGGALAQAGPAGAGGRSTTSGQNAARVAGARLEIVPPGASDATKAGTQSGISAGGEGAMLQQELIQTKETLAARDAEAQELKSRVAELEKLQQQQQQLIAMKDSELAAAQQRLAQTHRAQTQASLLPWALGLGGALVLGGVIAWVVRRRDHVAPKFRAPPVVSASSIADAFAPGATGDDDADEAPAIAPEPVRAPTQAAPAWHTGSVVQQELLEPQAQAAHERLELARSYLHLGDMASARQLLGEVVINGDQAARQQASRMLRELEQGAPG